MNSYNSSRKKRNPRVADDDQLRIIFDNTNEHGICMLDRKGTITSWNISAATLMGYSEAEVLGKNFKLFFSREEVARKVPQKTLTKATKQGSFVAEGIRVRKDGTHFWAQSFITLTRDGIKKSPSFVLITQDVTKARMHNQRKEQEREEYIGIASHELKNPITALALYAELLGSRLELERDKQNLQMLRDMQSQTSRLVALVDDLLLVNKIDAGTLVLHKEEFSVDALVAKTVQRFRPTAPSHDIHSFGKFGKLVKADSNRITQVLINLLTNAVKYSPQANKVLVHVGTVAGKCVVSVQDFGPGISKKNQHAVFNRFFRANDSGTEGIAGSGLGLHIAKAIIKKHHERLWVKSVRKKGSTFSFSLSSR